MLYGDACGHPNNRPKDIREAEERVWLVKKGKVVGWGETVFFKIK